MKSFTIINSVIQEIIQQGRIKGLLVTETLAAFMIRAVLLYPDNDFKINDDVTKQQMDKIIQLSVERLTDTDSASVDTIRMQIIFDENFFNYEDYTKQEADIMNYRLKDLFKEIISSEADTCKLQECLYRKIAYYIIIMSSMGNYEDPKVIEETMSCLGSVLPISNIEKFISMGRKKKEAFLCGLIVLVSGVRLMLHEQKEGGAAGIIDLSALMKSKLPEIDSEIQKHVVVLYKQLDFCYKFLEFYRGTPRDLPLQIEERFKEALINACQHILYSKIIKKHMNSSMQVVDKLTMLLEKDIETFKSISLTNLSSNSCQLFPQLSKLGKTRAILQTHFDYTNKLENVWNNLKDFGKMLGSLLTNKELSNYLDMMTTKSLTPSKAALDSYKDGKKKRKITVQPSEDLYIVYADQCSNFQRLSIQYRGFCCWTLVVRDRILVPGNPSLGLVCYKGLCYAFTSRMAAQDFITDPNMYIRGVAELARKNPELIHLLRLFQNTASLMPYEEKSAKELAQIDKPIIKTDSGSQTIPHPISSHIDHSYEWNEWQLRRLAIKLTNLRTKKTHSTQTKMSTLRKDISTQVYVHKQTETQTKIDAHTNVPRPQIFLAGLRGANTDFQTVDLTLRDDQDFEEDEEYQRERETLKKSEIKGKYFFALPLDEEDEDFYDFEIAGMASRHMASVKHGYKSMHKDEKMKKKDIIDETISERTFSVLTSKDDAVTSKIDSVTSIVIDKDAENEFEIKE